MITETRPNGFNPELEVVSCFCKSNGEILLLKRQSHKPQGGTWGVPAGKMENGESPLEAMTRELHEECGIESERSSLSFFKTVYVRYADVDFIYHIFHTSFRVKPGIQIRESEHLQYTWITPKKALDMNLIEDLDQCIKLYFADV